MVGEALAALQPHNMLRVQETLWLHIIIIAYYGGQVPKSNQLPNFCYVDFYYFDFIPILDTLYLDVVTY